MSLLKEDPHILTNNKSGFDSRNMNETKLKYVRFHEETALSKQALKLEKKLLLELNNIMKFFKDNYTKDMTPYNFVNNYNDFRRDMEVQVTNIIRSYVTKVYTFTTEYVADSLSVPGFLTKSDIDTIEELTNDFKERFFGRIKKVLDTGIQKFYNSLTDVFMPASFDQRGSSIDENEEQLNVLVKNIERSESYLFSSLAILIINHTLNKTTLLKTRKIVLNDGTLDQRTIFQADFVEIEQLAFYLKYYELEEQATEPIMYYIWKTAQDDRVCEEYCLPLEDTVYLVDDFVPEPETDTHYNCRCRIMLGYINPEKKRTEREQVLEMNVT